MPYAAELVDETCAKPQSLKLRMETYWGDEGRRIDIAIGRDIGFDFARLGIALPADCPKPVEEGFLEGEHVYARYQEPSSKYDRKLLRLRLSAFRRNRVLDSLVTPEFLAGIDVRYCPITRITLTSGTGTDSDATVDRVFNGGGYAIGNIAVMSKKANQAKGSLMPLDILQIASTGDDRDGLSTVEWMRLACLTALASPPGYPQSHLPLFVYPPNGILLTNGFTLIQQSVSAIAAGTLQPRWESEMRAVLSGKQSKRDFDGLMQALIGQVSRRLRGISEVELQWFGICDSWAVDLVYRRYSKLVAAMSKTEVKAMVSVATRAQQSLRKFTERDLASWALNTRGYTHGR